MFAFHKNIRKSFSAKSLAALLAIILMFSGQIANAQEVMQGGATAGIGPFFSIITNTVFYIIGGGIALFLTTNALQWVINNQSQLINFNNNFIVQGTKITQGLADMLILLAFVVAAFGLIFKQREFEAKKTLFWLVVAVILTRFGVLLVKMMVDIGNLAMNTIVGTNGNLLGTVTQSLINDILWMVGTILVSLAVSAAAYAVPWLNVIPMGATIGGISIAGGSILAGLTTAASAGSVAYFGINFITKWVFQLVASYLLAGVFFTYIILFVSRIFMLQILAVVSPLAILSLALPQTKRFFFQWWNSLFKWTFVGIWTLFFLVLGLGSAGFILPKVAMGDSNVITGFLSGIGIDRYMLYYLFLIVYLTLVKDMALNDARMGTMFRSAMTGAGMVAFTHLVKPTVGKAHDFAIEKQLGAKTGAESNLWGLTARATDAKTMSSIRSIFSDDASRIEKATSTEGKGWMPFKTEKSLKDWGIKEVGVESMVTAKVNELQKEFSWDKAFASLQGDKLGNMEAIAALRQTLGKKDETANVQAFIGKLGSKKAAEITEMMLDNNLLNPQQMQSLAINNLELLRRSSKLANKINDLDIAKTQTERMKTLLGPDLPPENYKGAATLAVLLKGAATRRNELENLPDNIFDDDNNSRAFLANATTQIFGHMQRAREKDYEKLGQYIQNMTEDQFNALAQVNPTLIKGMARHWDMKKFLPQSTRVNNQPDGEIDYDKLSKMLGPNVTASSLKGKQKATPQPPPPDRSGSDYGNPMHQ